MNMMIYLFLFILFSHSRLKWEKEGRNIESKTQTHHFIRRTNQGWEPRFWRQKVRANEQRTPVLYEQGQRCRQRAFLSQDCTCQQQTLPSLESFKMHILYGVLILIWISSVTGEDLRFSNHLRLRELLNLNVTKKSDDAPSLSLFIPPPQLVSIVTGGVKHITETESKPKPVRQSLIVDPLLALLNQEEAKLLQMLLPDLFLNHNNESRSRTKAKVNQQESAERIGSTSTTTTMDPLLNWLFNGLNESDVVTHFPPTPGQMISMTDDMLISMLQQAVNNFSPTTFAPPTTEGWTRPVGIGDDLLATLLKSLQLQTDSPVVHPAVTRPSLDEPVSVESVGVDTTTVSLLDTLTTNATDLEWPEKVKPGGGISDEAIAAIIRDVNNINKNISASVGVADLSDDFLEEKPVTISDGHVAQLIHDVGIAVNTSTPNSAEIENESNNLNSTKSGTQKSKKQTKAKNSASGNGKKGSKNPNRLRKKPGKKTTTKNTTLKPNLWERLVQAASNAIFGEKKPVKGLFQVDDILDLLSNL
uniref:Uncharacterized protein n=1 Tax=Strigamia maritima TaxID=126957 RepID=T1J1F9_STRMM